LLAQVPKMKFPGMPLPEPDGLIADEEARAVRSIQFSRAQLRRPHRLQVHVLNQARRLPQLGEKAT